MKVYWGVEVLVHAFLTSKIDWVKVSIIPKPLYSRETVLIVH
jgi:hypothetical protein